MVRKIDINADVYKYIVVAIIIVSTVFCYGIVRRVNSKFKTSNITKIITNSKFVGYAVFINKGQLLTTYDLTETPCGKDKDSGYNLYVLYGNDYYYAMTTIKDVEYGLSILELNTKKSVDIKNYALISDKNNITKLFTVKNLNEPFRTGIYKANFKNLEQYLYNGSMDVYSQKQGSPLFDSNMSLYGLVLTKTKNNIFGIFTNKTIAIEKNYIKRFLDKYKIEYKVNSSNIDLNVIDNYKDKVIAKVICVQKIKRIPKIITLQ